MLLIVAGSGAAIISNLPQTRVSKQLKAGDVLVKEEDYVEAIASYQAALEIDSKSVEAYRAMAGAYLTSDDVKSAEQILYDGWENTQDEGLLQYYCAVMLNEAVEEINNQSCTFHTVSKCITVLEKDSENADALNLMEACCQRLLQTADSTEENTQFCTTMDCDNTCGFSQYLDILERLSAIYDTTGKDEIKSLIRMYSVPDMDTMVFNLSHITKYRDLLNRIRTIEDYQEVEQIITCLDKALWVQDTFTPAFAAFDSGEFEPIKEFINSEVYLAIRDEFIAGTMEYWYGKTYIPVSREKMRLQRTDSGYQFSFLDYVECPETAGVIQVWGAKQEDAGVQRAAISYEPASTDGSDYPHITYEIIYLYSNVKIGGDYVPQMNYRFETKTATEEGITTDLIGDWGGAHEWETTY